MAIAASHSIDVENFYVSGVNQKIALNDSLAKTRAQNFLKRLSVQSELKSFKLLEVEVEQDSVTVLISADPQLPFGYLIPGVNPQIQSSAKALIKTG